MPCYSSYLNSLNYASSSKFTYENANIMFTSSSGLLESLSAQADNPSGNISTRFPVSEFSIFNKTM